ncbi:MAG: DUF302 domain-containing protein [Proteobacteria bacterium]|nr:DUF302 domain-containing protein [Pseudomonadota bacterium]
MKPCDCRLFGRCLVIVQIIVLSTFAHFAASSDQSIVRNTTDKSFEDVIFELEFAITELNFRITGRNEIGKGLRERGYKDVPEIEVIHFCNLEYVHEVILLDPGFIAQMTCRFTVHTSAEGTVISYMQLPESHPNERINEFARRMNVLTRKMVDFVLEKDPAKTL